MKNKNQQLEICQNSCRRLVEKQVESTARIAEIAKTLKQVLIDWEDDEVCSPHRVHHALAGPMAKILERLRNVAWDMEDACALQSPDATKTGPEINLDS